jgi:hypothetical protein
MVYSVSGKPAVSDSNADYVDEFYNILPGESIEVPYGDHLWGDADGIREMGDILYFDNEGVFDISVFEDGAKLYDINIVVGNCGRPFGGAFRVFIDGEEVYEDIEYGDLVLRRNIKYVLPRLDGIAELNGVAIFENKNGVLFPLSKSTVIVGSNIYIKEEL